MSNASPSPPPIGIPQVLLFGHSGAGKSALLGALLKAGETQSPTLRGEVREASGCNAIPSLASIRDAVYLNTDLVHSDKEITSYTLHLRSSGPSGEMLADPESVIVNDCSGKAAESLIANPDKLRSKRPEAPVARAVVDADAIVLLVDAASDDEQLQEAFEEFDGFLAIVSKAKVNAREVGGFPILLVLTQCDRLARVGDTQEWWEARVKHRSEQAWAKFDAFLKDADPEEGLPSPFLPFGSVDLNVYAVAVRYPKLVDVHAQANTPYGVAELFRDCFAIARTHRHRVTASDRRLRWTVRFALALVSFLLLGVLAVALFQPPHADPGLAERVIGYQLNEPEAAVRLVYPTISRNKQALANFRDDPGFIALPDDLRGFVLGRLKEIDDYEAFRSQLATAVAPGDTRTLEDLAKVEAALKGTLALPSQYGWGDTLAAQLRDKWLADVAAIRKAEEAFLARERDFIARGTLLMLRRSLGDNWRTQVDDLAAEASQPPVPLTEPLAGSPTIEQPRGQAVINRVPYEFERVYNARKDWEAIRERLMHLRDIADALGLTSADKKLAVLDLPEPGPGVDSAALPAALWAALFRNFAGESDNFREWETRNFPDPARSLLAERLERSFRTGARHVHALIRAKMGPDPKQADTPMWWRDLSREVVKPGSAFAEWGRLLHLLARLRDPAASEPIDELASFLRQEKFDLDLRGFDLSIPLDLSIDKIAPAGPFVITITPKGGTAVTKQFKQSQEGVREGSATTYRFASDGDAKLTYQPGDELRAELPLKVGTKEFKLVWDTTASRTFQFDKLAHDPKLVKAAGASETATGVRIAPTSGSTMPRLPALFPDVRK
jgi:hypothetical protein